MHAAESPEVWARREALLDRLLALDEAAREAALVDIANTDAADAHALRGWLQGITRSHDDDWLGDVAADDAGHDGETVGNWRALQLLGRGGMGEVWLGERADGLFAKQVAIKFIRDDRPALRAGIESERRLLAGLHHPGIVRLLDAGTTRSGRPYLVTEYIDGIRLDRWLVEASPNLSTRLALFRQVADAVAHAHERLVVHGDIKPANVLVDAAGHSHLLDFGIAYALVDGEGEAAATHPALTPEFAAPEIIDGGRAGVRTDVFALGGLLYYLLAGEPPLALRGRCWDAIAASIRRDMPPPLQPRIAPTLIRHVSPHWLADLDAIAMKAMAKRPEDRYGTVEALLRDIDAARHDRRVSARPLGRLARGQRFLRRHRNAVVAAMLVLSALLAGLAGTLWQAHRAGQERDIAAAQARRAEAEARNANAVRDFLVGVFEAANPEQAQGNMPTALELLDAGVRRIERDLGDQPVVQAELLAALGDTYAGLGRYDQAETLLRRALDAANRHLGEQALPSRRILARYARVVQLRGGPYDELRARLQRALAAPADTRNEACAIDAELRARYGGLLHRTGELEPATRMLEQAVAEARSLGPSAQPILVTALHQQVLLDEARGQRERAIGGLREIIALLQTQPVRSIADQQLAMQNLASMLGESGRGDEAEAILGKVVESNVAVYGPEHPATISSKVELARAQMRLGRKADARKLLEAMVALAAQRHGEASEASLLARTNLAALEFDEGHPQAAIALLEAPRRVVIARDGAHSPRALMMLQNIARLRMAAGDIPGAQRDLEQLLAALHAIGSDATAEPLALLGDIARQRGDPARARQLHRQALAVYAEAGDTTSFDVQDHRLALAEDARDLGDFASARAQAQAGLQGLIALGQSANAGMIDYARYLLAQFDTLEQRCDATGQAALEAMQSRQRDSFGQADVPAAAAAWRVARLELYLGLCRDQVQPGDAQARRLAETAAQRIVASPAADPHTRQLAETTLRRTRR